MSRFGTWTLISMIWQFMTAGFQMATLDKKMLQLGPPPRIHPRLILMSFSSELEQYKVSVLLPNGPFQNKIQLQQILELWGTLQGCKHKLPEKLKKQICVRSKRFYYRRPRDSYYTMKTKQEPVSRFDISWYTWTKYFVYCLFSRLCNCF